MCKPKEFKTREFEEKKNSKRKVYVEKFMFISYLLDNL